MLYSSVSSAFYIQGYNVAISTDGIVWERVQAEPIVPRSDFRRSPWLASLNYQAGVYYLYIEVESRAGTDIFAGVLEGSFFSD